jgi:serine/threonine protein kinase
MVKYTKAGVSRTAEKWYALFTYAPQATYGHPILPHHRQCTHTQAIKAVRRKNIKAEKMKLLRRRTQPLPSSPAHVRLTDRLGSTEQKILKEIAIMRRCAHPNIVQLLDVIDDKMNEKIYMGESALVIVHDA